MDHRLVVQTLRGVKRNCGVKSKFIRLPITTSIIRTVISHYPKQQRTYNDKLLFAAMCMGTFGLLRAGEFVQTDQFQSHSLRLAQLTAFDTNSTALNIQTCSNAQLQQIHHYVVSLLRSKVDPFGRGAEVIISNSTATESMIEYLQVHPLRRIAQASVFVNPDQSNYTRAQLLEFAPDWSAVVGPAMVLAISSSSRRPTSTSKESVFPPAPCTAA